MASVKEENEDFKIEETYSVKPEETFSVKPEETEEQTDLMALKEENQEPNEMEEEDQNKRHDFMDVKKNIKTETTLSQKKVRKTKYNRYFNCPHCGKSFTQKHNLNFHMKIHTGEKPFQCDQCEKSFNKKANLNAHMRVHTGERPFTCQHCGINFTQKGNLKKHLRIHTGEKPFTCPQCGKSFTEMGHLKGHVRFHTGEKPFTCPQCEKSFTKKESLNSHIKVHTGEKPISRDPCERSSYVRTALIHTQRDNTQLQLKETQRLFQQRIQEREKDLQKLRKAVASHKRSAQTAVEDSEKIFTELIRSIERSRSEATQRIRDQEKTAVSRAEGRLKELEQEINDLRWRDAELEQLSHTQDHIHFLQSVQSLSAPPESTDVNDNPFSSLCSFDGVRESVRKLKDKLEDFCKEELKKISERVTFTNIVPKTRNDFLQYSHELTLDLNTVNKRLCLSEENRVITFTYPEQSYPDHPDRFDDVCPQVLCRESVCGRCYWEIEWSGRGVCISVSYKSISRKGRSNECRFGSNDQSWSLICSLFGYSFRHNNIQTKLVKPIGRKIGVCVDPSAGTLSFYSVSDAMSLIHTVQTTFTQPLYPGFRVTYPGSSVKLLMNENQL